MQKTSHQEVYAQTNYSSYVANKGVFHKGTKRQEDENTEKVLNH